MEVFSYILPFAYLVGLESAAVRWVAGGRVPGLFSRIFATNLAGLALLMFVSLTGWLLGWWPDIRNWALRDSFFLFFLIKAPLFSFLFRRWGMQRVFTLHVLSNFTSIIILSLMFVYSPWIMAIRPVTEDDLDQTAIRRLMEIRDAVERYKVTHGYFPAYLWGGDAVSWGTERPPDPLLNEGYLSAYPVNPLNLRKTYFEPRRVPGWRELWFGYKSEEFLHVRALWAPIIETEPRFGYRGTKMGNVLPDSRMPETLLPENVRFAIDGIWMPGEFFYRAYDIDGDGHTDAYIMGVFGDENAQATVDCYDYRLDRLTTLMDDQLLPSASDRVRDGVKYLIKRGFPEIETPSERQFPPGTAFSIDPETGELIQRPWPFGTRSAGETEPAVTPPTDENE
jgi:hypothetical protein